MDTKICTKCGGTFPATEEYFHRSKDCRSGLKAHCKKCGRAAACVWAASHAEQARRKSAAWRAADPERYVRQQRAFYSAHKERYRARTRMRYATILRVRVASANCSRRNMALRARRVPKRGSFSKFLGASTTQYIAWLENQFLPGMTWENRGTLGGPFRAWNCDHTLPVLGRVGGEPLFDLSCDEDCAVAFNYRNNKPMWAEDNRAKSDRVPHWDDVPPELQAICTPRIRALLQKVKKTA